MKRANNKRFDKKYLKPVHLTFNIHETLLNISENNIEEITNQISSFDFKTKDDILILASSFFKISTAKTKFIEYLAEVYKRLFELKQPKIQIDNHEICIFHLLPECTLELVENQKYIMDLHSIPVFLFLKFLTMKKVINFGTLFHTMIDETKMYYIQHFDFNRYLIYRNFFIYFYYDFMKISQNKERKFYQVLFPENLDPSNKENYEKTCISGVDCSSLATCIREDKLEELQLLFLNGQLNFNQQLELCQYERCSLNHYKPTLIQYAALNKSKKIFKFLLDNGSDINYNDSIIINYKKKKINIMDYAVYGGDPEILRLLEYSEFDITQGIKPSIKYFQNNILSWLIQHDNAQQTFKSILKTLVKCENLKGFFILLDSGFDINLQDERDGSTLLHYAAKYHKIFFVRLLLSNENFDINVQNNKKKTAADLAAAKYFTDICIEIINCPRYKWSNERIGRLSRSFRSYPEWPINFGYDIKNEINYQNIQKSLQMHFNFMDGIFNTSTLDFEKQIRGLSLNYCYNEFIQAMETAIQCEKYQHWIKMINKIHSTKNFVYDLYFCLPAAWVNPYKKKNQIENVFDFIVNYSQYLWSVRDSKFIKTNPNNEKQVTLFWDENDYQYHQNTYCFQ